MITDEMLATAAKELSLVIGATFPDSSKNVHHFSLRFRRKMNQLVKKTNHPVRYLWTQRVAGFILVLFIGFMIIFTASPTVRASVIGWIKEQYESYIEYFFPDKMHAQDAHDQYEITALPKDYSETQRFDTEGLCTVLYTNDNGDQIHFIYSKDPTTVNCIIMTDESQLVTTYVADYPADLYLPNDTGISTTIIWYDVEKETAFYISALTNTATIIEYAESIAVQ